MARAWSPHYGFDSEVVNFDRSIGRPTARLAHGPDAARASLDLDRARLLRAAGVAWRYPVRARQHWARAQPIARPRARCRPRASIPGCVFERDRARAASACSRSSRACCTCTCRTAIRTSCRCSTPALPDLNPVELFRTNRYVGADRVSDANQVSIGVTSRLLDAKTAGSSSPPPWVRSTTSRPRACVLPDEAPRPAARSDIVAQLALTAYQELERESRRCSGIRSSLDSERTDVNLQYKPAPDKVDQPRLPLPARNPVVHEQRGTPARLRSERLRPGRALRGLAHRRPLERLRPGGRTPCRTSKTLERFAGFEYACCCWGMRFGARRRSLSTHAPGEPGHRVSAAAGTHGPCQCRIRGGCFLIDESAAIRRGRLPNLGSGTLMNIL